MQSLELPPIPNIDGQSSNMGETMTLQINTCNNVLTQVVKATLPVLQQAQVAPPFLDQLSSKEFHQLSIEIALEIAKQDKSVLGQQVVKKLQADLA